MENLTIEQFTAKLKNRDFTVESAVKYFLNKCKQSTKNSILEVFDDAIASAKIIDKKIKSGQPVGKLCGVPIAIKDNILYKGHVSSAASKFLEHFVSPYNSTVVQKLLDEDAIIIGRANHDEFAMGTTGSYSAYSMTKNGLNDEFVSGGSSSGSASCVAEGLCLAALGTDTGGSVRYPASSNGLVGFKPTYGTVSRYGLIAFASSIEQCGILTKTVADNELLYSILCGKDTHDATTINKFKYKINDFLDIRELRIGRVKEVWNMCKDLEQINQYNKIFDFFERSGATVVDVSIKNIGLALPCYYCIATAEAASNLARFDGVKYGEGDPTAENLIELYKNTRSKYFGAEVKRRILIGNTNLGNENFAVYEKGRAVAVDVKNAFKKCFENVDCILMPTTSGSAPKIAEPITDPIALYLLDLFTVPANIAGVPSLSVPCGKANNGMPIGLQIICKQFNDRKVFEIAKYFEKFFRGAK